MGKRQDRLEDYEGFVEKFRPKKTTDDCYTPPAVYEAVKAWTVERYGLQGRPVVRPFWPGGDYEHHDYPEGCVVIDNPPFSIYARIVRFYLERGIDFLLFAPSLTQMVVGADCCYLCTANSVTYANGALVRTGFTTNLEKDTRMWTCPELRKAVCEACESIREPAPTLQKIVYPDHLITAATISHISVRCVDFRIGSRDSIYIRKVGNKSIFGCGLVLSERAAAERAAAERAAALVLDVPPFERYAAEQTGGVIF